MISGIGSLRTRKPAPPPKSVKAVLEVYPDLVGKSGFWAPSDYQPMLDSFGTVVVQVDDNGYQGDSRVLYRDGDRWGVLMFGWGSCSGCDALQACDSVEDVQRLMDELRGSIKWFDSAWVCRDYFVKHDWKGDYGWGHAEMHEFIAKALRTLDEA